MTSSWPAAGRPVDAAALDAFDALQCLVRAVRNARAEYSVDVARRIPATIVVASPALAAAVREEAAVLQALCKLDAAQLTVVAVAPAAAAGEESISLVVRDGVEVRGWGWGIHVEPAGEPLQMHACSMCPRMSRFGAPRRSIAEMWLSILLPPRPHLC